MFFSGFGLQNEQQLFKKYLQNGEFVVAGFSYGAIKAIQYTVEQLNNNKRIEKLQLFSPAYFNDQSKKFKRMQLIFFNKDPLQYRKNFIQNITYPHQTNMTPYISEGRYEELETLLYYPWDKGILQSIKKQGVMIEIFLGEKDKIVNTSVAKEYFRQFGEVYFIKNVGHILE